MKTDRLLLAIAVICFMIGVLLAFRIVPRCQEDVVLVGTGDFERGRWTSYACGPAVDDYIGGY